MKNLITIFCFLIFASEIYSQTSTEPIGLGTEASPYEIETLDNLYWLTQNSNEWSAFFIQTSDIDASATSGWDAGKGLDPIGNSSVNFEGVYDGDGYTISNLYIDRPSTNQIGLFGFVRSTNDSDIVIKNLTLSNCDITGDTEVGALSGYMSGCTVINCRSTGSVTATSSNGGGLIGSVNVGSIIKDCSAVTTVTSAGNAGGLLGSVSGTFESSYVYDSYSQGSVTSTDTYAGGFASSMGTDAYIINCFATGTVVGSDEGVGGFIGVFGGGEVRNCYSTGNVTGAYEVGGFAGRGNGTIDSCSSRGNVTATGTYFDGNKKVGGFVGYSNGTIKRSCSFGDAEGEDDVGGFIGENVGTIQNAYSHGNATRSSGTGNDIGGFSGDNSGTIEKAYSIGSVYFSSAADPTDKGFVANDGNGTYSNNFYDTDVSNQSSTGGFQDEYAADVSTSFLQNQANLESNNYDFTTPVWGLNQYLNNNYPYFTWQSFANTTITLLDISTTILVLDEADVGFVAQTGNVDVDFELYHSDPPNIPSNSNVIGKYWDIQNVDSGDVKVRLYYEPSDTAGFSGAPKIFHYNGSNWVGLPTSSEMVDGDMRYVETTNYYSGFSPVTVADAASPLPVELISFTGYKENNNIKLKWTTATEINNYGFEVQRKSVHLNTPSLIRRGQGGGWSAIGFVNGHGNSNSQKSYSFVDDNVAAGESSYRLKQIDFNGTYEYSDVINFNLKVPEKYNLAQNYPNPFNPTTVINYSIPKKGNVRIVVYDILGERVKTLIDKEVPAGKHKLEFTANNLSSGIYFYTVKSGKYLKTKKMILVK